MRGLVQSGHIDADNVGRLRWPDVAALHVCAKCVYVTYPDFARRARLIVSTLSLGMSSRLLTSFYVYTHTEEDAAATSSAHAASFLTLYERGMYFIALRHSTFNIAIVDAIENSLCKFICKSAASGVILLNDLPREGIFSRARAFAHAAIRQTSLVYVRARACRSRLRGSFCSFFWCVLLRLFFLFCSIRLYTPILPVICQRLCVFWNIWFIYRLTDFLEIALNFLCGTIVFRV